MRNAIALLAALLLGGCGEVPLLEEISPEQTCRRTLHVGPVGVATEVAEVLADTVARDSTARGSTPAEAARAATPDEEDREVAWQGPSSSTQRAQLNAWCAAVGPAVFGGWAEPPTRTLDSLTVVSWNVHVGGGELRRLVRDLRQGVLTDGRPVEHFVLLLQEAYREDDTVPAFDPGLPQGGGVHDVPPSGTRRDIVDEARELGLSVLYAPSMRNGEGRGDDAPEDRGNAILATLPLSEPLAIELPVARQRRVAVAAQVRTGPGDADRLLVTSVHLENDASGWTRDEEARLQQTVALIEALPDVEPAVAGGDFNTWSRGPDEALIGAMLRAFPDTPPFPPGHTYVRAYGLLRRQLDYLFFRLPDGARARALRVPDPYASDHLPIVGVLTLPRATEDGG